MTGRERFVVIALLVFIAAFVTISGCTVPAVPGGTGQLEGVVTIGPLCPVEPCNTSDEQRAAAYAARHLVVTREWPSPLTHEVPVLQDGHYRVALPEGRYRVDIAKNGIDRSPDVPVMVAIKQGETITVNLSIDTGIR